MNAPQEPVIHSHITDVLPEDHPLAYEHLRCDCGALVHDCSNECMQTWIEFADGKIMCAACFGRDCQVL